MHADKPYGTDTHTHIIWGDISGLCDHREHVTAAPPSSEVLGNCRSAAEEVGPQWLELLPETQHRPQRLAVLVQTGVELLDVQQRLLVHELQELLGLFGHLKEAHQGLPKDPWTTERGSLVVMDNECASCSHYKWNTSWNLDLNFQQTLFFKASAVEMVCIFKHLCVCFDTLCLLVSQLCSRRAGMRKELSWWQLWQ